MNRINISSKGGDYGILFHSNKESLKNELSYPEPPLIIADKLVYQLHPYLAEIQSKAVLLLEATEKTKTFPEGISQLLNFFSEHKANKNTRVLAIGGGVIQDVVTFCASIFHRGLAWELIPTTLLSMGDSCIGAKSSINFQTSKNQLGNFHSPTNVHIYPYFIKTLSDKDTKSGLAEIIKILSCANDSSLKDSISEGTWVLNDIDYEHLIYKSLSHKKHFIEEDEFDTGIRRHLNWGHTFGHAIESVTSNEIIHGYAVILGMDIANYYAAEIGLSPNTENKNFIKSVVRSNYYDTCPIEISQVNDIIEEVKKDKKACHGTINLILNSSTGFRIHPEKNTTQLKSILSNYIKKYLT